MGRVPANRASATCSEIAGGALAASSGTARLSLGAMRLMPDQCDQR